MPITESKMHKHSQAKKSKTPAAAAVHVHLPEEIITEILTRLPGKSVLRFRAVSKTWRRIATDPSFLTAHARLRPLEVVLYTIVQERPSAADPRGYTSDVAMETIPVSGDRAGWRRLFRYPDYVDGNNKFQGVQRCVPIASCAGVLLFRVGAGRYLICNPVTRRWADLRRWQGPPPWYVHIPLVEYGFYFHQSSGEFRLLCRQDKLKVASEYYILSTAGTTRRVSIPGADEAAAASVSEWFGYTHHTAVALTPVALHDRLHWLSLAPVLPAGDRTVVAFDTASETFHLLPAPPSARRVKLFDMGWLLAAADFGETHIDLWFLEGYGDAGRWERRHRVAAPPMLAGAGPWADQRVTAAGNDQGDVILGKTDSLMVYNVRTKTARAVGFIREAGNVAVPRHVFRESLVQHECFDKRPCAGLELIRF